MMPTQAQPARRTVIGGCDASDSHGSPHKSQEEMGPKFKWVTAKVAEKKKVRRGEKKKNEKEKLKKATPPLEL